MLTDGAYIYFWTFRVFRNVGHISLFYITKDRLYSQHEVS